MDVRGGGINHIHKHSAARLRQRPDNCGVNSRQWQRLLHACNTLHDKQPHPAASPQQATASGTRAHPHAFAEVVFFFYPVF